MTIPQIRAISGNTPQEAALLFNSTMMELAGMHPSFTREGDTYYIQYIVEIKEAESLVEEHELNGERHTCNECHHCVRDLNRFGDIDARKVWATCSGTGERIRLNSSVCEVYYEERG